MKKYNLTYPQKNIWLMDKFSEGTSINSVAGTIEISKDFDSTLCNRAINNVIKNNETIRFRVFNENGNVIQVISEYEYQNIEVVNTSLMSAKEKSAYVNDWISRPLFLEKNRRLYEFKIFDNADGTGTIMFKVHHILADAWTCSKVATMIIEYIEKDENDVKPLYSYTDYINTEEEYKNSDKYLKDKEFWQNYLEGIEEIVSLKDNKKSNSTYANRYSIKLNKGINEKINEYCKNNRISPYTLFLTAVFTYIYRVMGKSDIILGTPVLNRANFKEKQTFGMFVSTVPIRAKIVENEKFIELAKKISTDTMSIFRHQKYPYSNTLEYVHENTDINDNLYNIMVSYQNARSDMVDEDKYSTTWLFNFHINDELQIHVTDFDNTGILNINYDYKKDLFSLQEIQYLHTRIMEIIENAILDLDVDVENIRIMSKAEENIILSEFNNTKYDFDMKKSITYIFNETVTKNSNKTALSFNDKSITFEELDKLSNKLACFFMEKGISKGNVVAILMNRDIDILVAIFATLKLGATYIPIDPNLPKDRISYMLNDSKAKLVLTNFYADNKGYFNIKDINIDKYSDKDLNYEIDLENTMYILYTSGTTGKPKGVEVKYLGVLNLYHYLNDKKVFDNVENIISLTTISFDIFVFESIVALLMGKKVVIADEESQLNPNSLCNIIEKESIDMLQFTPTRMKMFLSNITDEEKLKSLKKIVLSGEKVQIELKEQIKNKFCNITIYNGYGPTENTVFSSFTDITNETEISIGKPVCNTKFYNFDEKQRLLPLNIPGELYFSGYNVAKGYINNEELTNKSFIEKDGEILYKSGDLAYIGFDQKTYCLGRKDNQVKINGIRIELDEISSLANTFDGIKDSTAILNNNLIYLYYIEKNSVDITKLKEYLKEKLPRYMIPTFYIKMENFPLTASGKIDKKKITATERKNYKEIRMPENDIQERIIKLVKNVLNNDLDIGIDTNVFELGIDSLKMIELALSIEKEFLIDLKISEMMKCNNVLDIEKYIISVRNENEKNGLSEIVNTKKSDIDSQKLDFTKLTPAQKGIFYNYSLNPDSTLYNVPFVLKFSNDIDVERLINSLKIVVKNNETLRIKLKMEGSDVVQYVDDNVEVSVEVKNINTNSYKKKVEEDIKKFDLLKDELFDFKIYRAPKYILLLVNIHHIIFDGVSINLFVNRLKDAYEGEENANKKYSAFNNITLINEDKLKSAKEFYLKEFEEELPLNNIILDKPRGKEKSINGEKILKKIDNKLYLKIKEFCNKNSITINSLFLSALNIVLAKYMYSDDITLGLATSGRYKNEDLRQIGMFVNTIAFRNKIDFNMNILDYIKYIKQKEMEYIDNSIYSYESLVKDLNVSRDSSRNPLFDIMFVFQNGGIPIEKFKDVDMKLSILNSVTSKFDMTFEIMPNKDDLAVYVEYSTDLFYRRTIADIVKNYINCVEYMINNSCNKVRDIEIISKFEKNKIVNVFNSTKTKYPSNKTIIKLFEEAVIKTPEKTAISYKNKKLTYSELNEISNKVARILIKENSVRRGDIVGIILDKSLESMIAIIAILKVGATYLPIEKDYPTERIKYILSDSNARYVINKHYFKNFKEKIQEESGDNLNIETSPEDIAYIMYTSGTTGNPKGVMITNKNVVRLVKNTNYIDVYREDRVLQTGSISFDATTFEYWISLLNNLTLYIISKPDMLNFNVLEKIIRRRKISILWLTSPLFNQIVEYNPEIFKNVRVLLVGGDVLSPKHINAVLNKYPKISIVNGYGPTENTTFSICNKIDKIYNDSIPIGKPISNSTAYVVDKCGKICGYHMPGEIIVGGDGIACGYLNNKELTDAKFIKVKNKRYYKTGDLGYFMKDGKISFIGRIDTQVKIRGFRIELAEIERKVLEFDYIKECTAIVDEDNKRKFIALYYTSDNEVNVMDLKYELKKVLPSYMVPSEYIRLENLPLNNNGKINKKALPKVIKCSEKDENELFGIYKEIGELFKSVLDLTSVSLNDNFFDIGGDSLMATKLITNAMARNINITYSDIFKYQTVKELGDMLQNMNKKDSISKDIDKYSYDKINKCIENNKNVDDFTVNDKIGNILMCGVTGFLGAHILDSFMKNESGKAYCLIRNKNGEDPVFRTKKILEFFFGKKYDKEYGKRIILLDGEITKENLGLSKENYDLLVNNVDLVINSAARVKHFGDLRVFEEVNINGAKNVTDFCLKNNKKLIHISTLSISGNMIEGGQVEQSNIKNKTNFDETKLYIGQNLDNVYAYTKYIAERYILEKLDEGLDAKILRMGNLTGRYDDGKFQPNVDENAFANRIKTMLYLKVIPENLLDFYLEFTPIDCAADAVIKLSRINGGSSIYHLFNSKHVKMNCVEEVLKSFGITLKHVTKNGMKNIIENILKDEKKSSKISGIILDLNKEKVLEYRSNIKVESYMTEKILNKLGFDWPDITGEYIKRYLEYLKNIGFLKI